LIAALLIAIPTIKGNSTILSNSTFWVTVHEVDDDAEAFALFVETYDGLILRNQVQMEWWADIGDGDVQYMAIFEVNSSASTWRVVGTPGTYLSPNPVWDVDNIFHGGDNDLDGGMTYVGP